MVWNVEFLATAKRQLQKIYKSWQKKILDYLEDEISPLNDPCTRGKSLAGDKHGLWRYREGDYRIICDIQDKNLVIAAITIGHRKDVMTDRTRDKHDRPALISGNKAVQLPLSLAKSKTRD